QMAGTVSDGGLLVQRSQFAGLRVDRERAGRAALLPIELRDFVDRIKEAAVRMDRQEGRARRFSGEFRGSQFASGQVQPGDIDAFAFFAGIRAEVNQESI